MGQFPFIRTDLCSAISPILLALVTTIFQGGSMWDEGCGIGAYLWFLMMTLPDKLESLNEYAANV